VDFFHRFRYFLEYAAARGLLFFLSLWPAAPGLFLGRCFGRLMGLVLGPRNRRMRENLSQAFPDWPAEKIERVMRDVWAHQGESVWEFSRIPGLDAATFFERVSVHGPEAAQKSIAAGKGMILFTSHAGNWEYASIASALLGAAPLAAVARRMKNPYMNDYVTRVRSHFKVNVLMHKQAVRESIRHLRSGGTLGLLIDQRITDGGLQVPFFGRPAATTGMAALLALRLGVPVHPVNSWRENGRMHVEFGPALDLSAYEPTADGIARATALMTSVLESWIRLRPEQWLWIHNRWKL
jgi:KDO2-lipid IV(A) lauroyltransferase